MKNKELFLEQIKENLKQKGLLLDKDIFFVKDFKDEMLILSQISNENTQNRWINIFRALKYIEIIDGEKGKFTYVREGEK